MTETEKCRDCGSPADIVQSERDGEMVTVKRCRGCGFEERVDPEL